MPRVYVVVTGPTHGVPRQPATVPCEAETVREALVQAAERTHLALLRDGQHSLALGVTVFLNGSDARCCAGLDSTLSEGDLLAVVCPATDT